MASKFRYLHPFEFEGGKTSKPAVNTMSGSGVILMLVVAALVPQTFSYFLRSLPYEEVTSSMNNAHLLLYGASQLVVFIGAFYVSGRLRILLIIWSLLNLLYTFYSLNQYNL